MNYIISKVTFNSPIEDVEYVSFYIKENSEPTWQLIAPNQPCYPETSGSNIGVLLNPITLEISTDAYPKLEEGKRYDISVTNNQGVITQYEVEIQIPLKGKGTEKEPISGPGTNIIQGPGSTSLMNNSTNLNKPTNLDLSGDSNPLNTEETTSQTIETNNYFFSKGADKVGLNVQYLQRYILITANEFSLMSPDFNLRIEVLPATSSFDIFYTGTDAYSIRLYSDISVLKLEIKNPEETKTIEVEGVQTGQWNKIAIDKDEDNQWTLALSNDTTNENEQMTIEGYEPSGQPIQMFGEDGARNNLLARNIYLSQAKNEMNNLLNPNYLQVKIEGDPKEFTYNPNGQLFINVDSSGDINIEENKIGDIEVKDQEEIELLEMTNETKEEFSIRFNQNNVPTLIADDRGYSLGLPGDGYPAIEFQGKTKTISSKDLYGYGTYEMNILRDDNSQNFIFELKAEPDYSIGTDSYFDFRNSNPGVLRQYIRVERTPTDIYLITEVQSGMTSSISEQIESSVEEKITITWESDRIDVYLDDVLVLQRTVGIPKFNSMLSMKHEIVDSTNYDLTYLTIKDLTYNRIGENDRINIKTETNYQIIF